MKAQSPQCTAVTQISSSVNMAADVGFVAENAVDIGGVLPGVHVAVEFLDLSVTEEAEFSDTLGFEEECLVALEDSDDDQCDQSTIELESGYLVNASVAVTEKFDSAASANMSGVVGRIRNVTKPQRRIRINGFNSSSSMVESVGINSDGRREYFVQSMPPNLVLLCANDYAHSGAVVLLPDSGRVLQLSESQQAEFLNYIQQFNTVLDLTVHNRTYEVCRKSVEHSSNTVNSFGDSSVSGCENAHSGTATRYFNSKVNVTNSDERVLVSLLMGLTFEDLYSMAKHSSVVGLSRDITIQSLNNFEHKYGRTPSVLQMAMPNLAGNTKGYMAPPEKISKIGQRVEADFFQSDFNEETLVATSDSSNSKKQASKLASHGGAIAMYMDIDVYSGYVHGCLVKSTANAHEFVKGTVSNYRLQNYNIQLFAADQGILTQSHFRVFMPESRKYLESENIRTECSEAYTHDHGTTHIERAIRTIKELIRFAVLYVTNNPNFQHLGFTKSQILKMWGDLFYWAMCVYNLKPCVNAPALTKFEVFLQRKPDLRSIRLLPIFSVLYVLRQAQSVAQSLQSNRKFWQRALYVGPSDQVPGAIRAAVVTNDKIQIVVTTNIKGVSDGGDINVYSSADRVTCEIINSRNISENSGSSAVSEASSTPPISTAAEDISVAPISSNSSLINSIEPNSELRGGNSGAVVSGAGDSNNHRDSVNSEMGNGTGSDKNSVFTSNENKNSRGIDSVCDNRKQLYAENRAKWGSREQRMARRNSNSASVEQSLRAVTRLEDVLELIEEAHYVDWLDHSDESFYFNVCTNSFIVMDDNNYNGDLTGMSVSHSETNNNIDCNHNNSSDSVNIPVGDCSEEISEDGFRAVKVGVPKSFTKALSDPVWGEAARKEFDTVTKMTGAIVSVDQSVARALISAGSEVLRMLTVYEEKMKDGVLVRKVRLVADGRGHHKHGPLYAPTPSREEFLVILQYFAKCDFTYYHLDEIRAFLNAPKQDKNRVLTKFEGNPDFYEIVKSVYGQKDAPRNYQDETERKMTQLGLTRLHMCSSVYIEIVDNDIVLVYAYVDDYFPGGSSHEKTLSFIHRFRALTKTTDPVMNASLVVGLELRRIPEKRLICVTMTRNINELVAKFLDADYRRCNLPMPASGYLVRDYEIEALPEKRRRLLNKQEIAKYMSIVGCLIWIQGIRFDIMFAVLYLAWFTKAPTQHHMNMALYCVAYLGTTVDMPLVLGGDAELCITGYSDASLATGPKGRSISGQVIKLNDQAGAIYCKATAGQGVKLSSFEAELDGVTSAMKSISRIHNVLTEMRIKHCAQSKLFADNKAMIDFVQNNNVAKGVRHMEMRLWYTREEYKKGTVALGYTEGKGLCADKLTKIGTTAEHRVFTEEVMGLKLVGYDMERMTAHEDGGED